MCCLLCECRCLSIKAGEFRCSYSATRYFVPNVFTVFKVMISVRLRLFACDDCRIVFASLAFFGRKAMSFWVEILYESCVVVSRFCFYVFCFVELPVISIIMSAHVRIISLPIMDKRSVAWHHQCSFSSLSKHLLLRHFPRSAICSVLISNVLDVEVSKCKICSCALPPPPLYSLTCVCINDVPIYDVQNLTVRKGAMSALLLLFFFFLLLDTLSLLGNVNELALSFEYLFQK